MTNAQYATFVKYLVEGNLDLVVLEEGISASFRRLVNMARYNGEKAIECMTELYKQYGVASWNRLCDFIKYLFTKVKGSALYAKIGTAISTAINWVKNVIGPADTKSLNVLKDRLSSYSHSCWHYLGLAGAAIISVIHKVASAFGFGNKQGGEKLSAAENNKAAYRTYLNKRVNRAVMESKAMFSDLTRLTEAVRVSEGPLDVVKGGVSKISGRINKIVNSFVDKMLPKATELWSKVSTIAKANKTLAIAITVCTACIFSFVGIRKYLASRKQSSLEQTIESVIAKKAKKGSSAGKKLAAKPKKAKPVKAKSNIKAAAKKMASKKK